MMDQSSAAERVDGRTARRDRNRLAVLDAVLALFAEGNLAPGVHEVAARSEVSLRSVYRYFEDADELISSAIERQLDLARPLFHISGLGKGPLPERLDRFSTRRVNLFANVRPVFRAATARAATDPRVHAGMISARSSLREQTYTMFGPELADGAASPERRVSLDMLTQFDALEYLVAVRQMSTDDVTEYLCAELFALLTPHR